MNRRQSEPSVYLHILGCDKNRVDGETLLWHLDKAGFSLSDVPKGVDVIVVNTCAFIESAKREAVDKILELAACKPRLLVVTGCLAERYREQLKSQLPEAGLIWGVSNYAQLPDVIRRELGGSAPRTAPQNTVIQACQSGRILTTPPHYAYLKISEGCDNNCSYCAIPKIRGRYTERSVNGLVEEASSLIDGYGVSEINLVAQDVTRFSELIKLLEKLTALNVKRVRLLYCYPELLTPELINYVANNPKMCDYFDIPMQHVSDKILAAMRRRTNGSQHRRLIESIRKANAKTAIRSTFIAGFPGENEADFAELAAFLQEYQLDYAGFFAYSDEDGTDAAQFSGKVPKRTTASRVKKLEQIQSAIMQAKAKRAVSGTAEVLLDGVDMQKGGFYGRTQYQAPEVDTVVWLRSKTPLRQGQIYTATVTGTDGLDLVARISGDINHEPT